MAKTVYNTETILLQDETDVTLKPLVLGRLKKFMKAWGEFDNIKVDDDAFDIYLHCGGIALAKELVEKGKVENPFTDSEEYELTDEYKKYLEDVLDMDTIFKVLEVCGGLKLNDPKVQEAALAAMQAAAGKN